MRLTDFEIKSIKELFVKNFSPGDHLWLFGSRVDDTQRGGDIDLYIETSNKDIAAVIKQKRKFLVELKMMIGDQKIDVVINTLITPTHLPIYDVARQNGVLLV